MRGRYACTSDSDYSDGYWGSSSGEIEGDEDAEGGLPGEGPPSSASCQEPRNADQGQQETVGTKRKGRSDSTSSLKVDYDVEERENSPRAKRQRPADEPTTDMEGDIQIPRRPRKARP